MSLAELSNTCWALALLNPQFLDDDGGREVWAHLLESVSGLEEGKVLSQVFHTKLLLGLDLPQHSQAEEAWKATVSSLLSILSVSFCLSVSLLALD